VISEILGGVGLFLLGMTLLTEGLKAVAGGVLRDILTRFTGGPIRAFLSGIALTVLVQASSATVVMTIGFVSAGIITFTQAISVMFGAAVGTTSTSWLVAFFGLRYSILVIALPVIGTGALLRVFGRGHTSSAGMAIAGFGLMFLGVGTLQEGMRDLATRVDIEAVAGATTSGRLLLILIGMVMTVVMQSSTAAVATTLTALSTGTIDFQHAAALVIGHNMGTAVHAAIAAAGGSVPARRTALSFILLNIFSGVLAFFALPLWLGALTGLETRSGLGPPLMIAIFHTGINLAGVVALLPLMSQYAAFIARLVPDQAQSLTRYLDTTLLSMPSVAIEAVRRTVVEAGITLIPATRSVLDPDNHRRLLAGSLETVSAASVEGRRFLGRIRTSPDNEKEYNRHLGVLHSADHIDRLLEALYDPPDAETIRADATLREVAASAEQGLRIALSWLEAGGLTDAPRMEPLSLDIAERRRNHRPVVLERTASGQVDPEVGLQVLDAMRWVDRAVYHVWRATYHLDRADDNDRDFNEVFEDGPTKRNVISRASVKVKTR
jgi:phosphate:Na+ symporter